MLIKSEDRSNGSSHNFICELSIPVEGKYLVKNCFIPNTCYNIDSHNNHFALTTATHTIHITIPPGNYTRVTLSTILQTLIVNRFFEVQGLTVSCIANVSTVTGKLTITIDLLGNQFVVNQVNIIPYGKVYNVLGIQNKTTLFVSSNGIDRVLFGSNIIQLTHATSLGVIIGSPINNYENVTTSAIGNIYIPMNLEFGFYRMLTSGEFPQYVYFERTRSISIKVVDTSDGSLLSLNGGNFELFLSKVD